MTNLSLQLATKQTETAVKQLTQSSHAEQIDDRPWVKTIRAGVSINNSFGLPGFFVVVTNVGKIPANNVRFTMLGGHGNDSTTDVHILRENVDRMPNNAILPPNDEQEFLMPTVMILAGSKVDPITSTYTKGYAKGIFRLDGGITYTDLNGTKGYTRFCYMLIDGASKYKCVVDNEMQ